MIASSNIAVEENATRIPQRCTHLPQAESPKRTGKIARTLHCSELHCSGGITRRMLQCWLRCMPRRSKLLKNMDSQRCNAKLPGLVGQPMHHHRIRLLVCRRICHHRVERRRRDLGRKGSVRDFVCKHVFIRVPEIVGNQLSHGGGALFQMGCFRGLADDGSKLDQVLGLCNVKRRLRKFVELHLVRGRVERHAIPHRPCDAATPPHARTSAYAQQQAADCVAKEKAHMQPCGTHTPSSTRAL